MANTFTQIHFGIEYDDRFVFNEIDMGASLQDANTNATISSTTERDIPNGM